MDAKEKSSEKFHSKFHSLGFQSYLLRRCFSYVFGVQIPPHKVFGSLGITTYGPDFFAHKMTHEISKDCPVIPGETKIWQFMASNPKKEAVIIHPLLLAATSSSPLPAPRVPFQGVVFFIGRIKNRLNNPLLIWKNVFFSKQNDRISMFCTSSYSGLLVVVFFGREREGGLVGWNILVNVTGCIFDGWKKINNKRILNVCMEEKKNVMYCICICTA